MRKLPIFLFVLIPLLSWGESLESLVDFDIELSDLNNQAAARQAAADGRIVILEGLLQEFEIADSGGVPEIVMTLVNGAWIGTTDVEAYSCLIRFAGAQWVDRFRPVDEGVVSDSHIPSESRLLIAARVTGYDPTVKMPKAEGLALRVLR